MVMQHAQEIDTEASPSLRRAEEGDFPYVSDAAGMLYVAVSVIIMAFSAWFTVFPIFIFLLIWFRHIFYKGVFILSPSPSLFATLIFPFLCCYSAFWSDYPLTTLYHGIELLTLALSATIMMRIVPVKTFIKGLLLGIVITLGITLASGNYTVDYLSKVSSLTGFFGSKNEVGFFAEIGIYLSLLMLGYTNFFEKLIFSFIPLIMCAACLYLSKSATSVASMIMLLGMSGTTYIIMRMPQQLRGLAIAGVFLSLITGGLIIAAGHFDIFDATLNALGKNPTLTGRTYLWSEGLRNGMERPMLGYGYTAFWIPGRPEAEEYWSEFFIPGKTGFHFHNLFIQTFVDVGLVGLSLMVWSLIANCGRGIGLLWRRGLTLESGLVFGLSWMFLLRACFEVDVLGPYGMGPLLFFALMAMQAPVKRAIPTPNAE